MLTTVVVRLRDNVKKWEGITVHDKDKNLVTLLKWGEVESVECTEADARSYVANYGALLETVTQEDLNKQVSEIASFLKKKFPKEFGKGVVEAEKDVEETGDKKDEAEWTDADKNPTEDKKDDKPKEDEKTTAKK